MVGHVTRFGILSKCKSLGNTGQEVSSKYIPLKSFLIVGIFLDLNIWRGTVPNSK